MGLHIHDREARFEWKTRCQIPGQVEATGGKRGLTMEAILFQDFCFPNLILCDFCGKFRFVFCQTFLPGYQHPGQYLLKEKTISVQSQDLEAGIATLRNDESGQSPKTVEPEMSILITE